MRKRGNIHFADKCVVLGGTPGEQDRSLNDCLKEATRACGDLIFEGISIRIDLYHVRRFEAGSKVDWHRHPFAELTLVEGGPIQYEHSDTCTTLRDGQVFFMPPFEPHRWTVPTEPTILHGFMLTIIPVPDGQHSLMPALSDAADRLDYHLEREPLTVAALLQAEKEASQNDALGIEAAAGYLRAGLAQMVRRICKAIPPNEPADCSNSSSTIPMALEQAVAFITTNLAEQLDVATVASQVNLSTRQLDRLFNEAFEMPTGAFLLHTRLERACHLLVDSDLSIKLISHTCGFSDPNYFSRIFRKRHGKSPVEYRGRS